MRMARMGKKGKRMNKRGKLARGSRMTNVSRMCLEDGKRNLRLIF
jgi:hypothetical protein